MMLCLHIPNGYQPLRDMRMMIGITHITILRSEIQEPWRNHYSYDKGQGMRSLVYQVPGLSFRWGEVWTTCLCRITIEIAEEASAQ